MSKPIIVCGLGRVGWRVLEFLRSAHIDVVVIDDRCSPDDPRLDGARLVRGDCRNRETLEQAGVAASRGVLIATSDDLLNISTTLMVRALDPDVRVVLRVFNENLIGRLGKAIHNIFPLSPSALTAPLLAVKALTGQALGTFRIEGPETLRRQVAELIVRPTSPLIGRVLKEIVRSKNLLALVHVPVGGQERFLTEIDLSAKIQADDHLGLCGEPGDLAELLAEEQGEKHTEPIFAGWLRRMQRVTYRTLAQVDAAVIISTLIVLGVLIVSTLVFFWFHARSLADALYHTVSIIATVADMRAEMDSDAMKFFVSLLRILGAALIAIFTAILTNYLIKASLGGALEVRRIPDSGHYLVVGLGSVGFRVVEELLGVEERVVAIEIDAANRFITSVRRRGTPVLVGDATVTDVLVQAHAPRAAAVIVCTSNDLVNLEVALLVRELNPKQRVVVLQSEPHLAQLLRQAANVRLAVSMPVLAAPAFVAGLFGDRVLSVFKLRDRLMAVLDFAIGPQDAHLIGQSARTVAIDHGLLPAAVVPADGSPPPRNPWNAGLGAGDRLIAVIALKDLEHLLKREPAPVGWAVEVTGYPPGAKEWLMLFVQRARGITVEEALAALDQLPLLLESNLTRGQALDLLALLEREHVRGAMRLVV